MQINATLSKTVLRLALLLLCGFVILIAWQQSLPNKFDVYTVGEWLINYGGGLTRRGFAGFLLIHAAHVVQLSPESMVFLAKAVCLAILYLGMAKLCQYRRTLYVGDWFVLLSPCTFLFPVLDRWGGARKEVVLLALFMAFALRAQNGKAIPRTVSLSLILLSITLMHEGLFFFYPLFLTLLALMFNTRPYRLTEMGWILLPSAAVLVAITVFQPPVTETVLLGITQAISPTDFAKWNGGAIETMRYTMRQGIANVGFLVTGWAIVSLVLGWLMSVGPIFLRMRQPAFAKARAQYLVAVLGSLACQLPLYVMATDWGRWIYVSASLLTIAYFAAACHSEDKSDPSKDKAIDAGAVTVVVALTCAVALLAHWTRIPHCCVSGFQFH